MSNKVTINKQAIWKAFKEDGKKKNEIRKEMHPEISVKNWEKIWEAVGLKGKRPEKQFDFTISDDIEPSVESNFEEREESRNYPDIEESDSE